MVGKDLIMATLLGSGGGSSGSGGGEGEKSPLDALIDRSITEISSDAETVGEYAFDGCVSLTAADFPRATEIKSYAFYACSSLLTANFPLLTRIGSYAFQMCTKMEAAVFPSVNSIGSNAFSSAGVVKVNFPVVTDIPSNAFQSCRSLIVADFANAKKISSYAFAYAHKLSSLVLRSESLCTLSAKTAFDNCYHMLGITNATYNPDGLHDGYVYVPRSLIEEYPAATNWSALALQFRALEDYTVDGTITGELDESKI